MLIMAYYYGGGGVVSSGMIKLRDGSGGRAPGHMTLLVRQDWRDGSLGGCGWWQGLVAGGDG